MHRSLWLAAVIVGALSFTGQPGAQAPGAASGTTRIGVFDSRLVAVAYYNTDEHRAAMRQLMTDLNEAKAAGAGSRAQELEFQGPALQNLAHYQVFSTASIPNIMDKLAAVLPKVAAEARVSILVSKWEIVYRAPDVEYVDVTDALVAQFKPSPQTLKWIASGKDTDPMPLLEAVKTLRPEK